MIPHLQTVCKPKQKKIEKSFLAVLLLLKASNPLFYWGFSRFGVAEAGHPPHPAQKNSPEPKLSPPPLAPAGLRAGLGWWELDKKV